MFTSEVFRKLPDLAPPEFIIGTLEVLAKEQPVVAAPEAFGDAGADGLLAEDEGHADDSIIAPPPPAAIDDPVVEQLAAAAAE